MPNTEVLSGSLSTSNIVLTTLLLLSFILISLLHLYLLRVICFLVISAVDCLDHEFNSSFIRFTNSSISIGF